MPSSGLVGWRRWPKHKKKTPSRIRLLAVTVNGEIKSCCCVLGSGVVGWRRSKKKITKNFRKSETAVACQAAASWAGVDGPNKKQGRAVEERRGLAVTVNGESKTAGACQAATSWAGVDGH